MILSHVLLMNNLGNSLLYNVTTKIFFSFMGFFFWKSGRFFKRRNFRVTVKKLFNKLIKPYGKWLLISLCLELAYAIVHGDAVGLFAKGFIRNIIYIEAPSSNAALWFLPTLFICQIIFSAINTKLKPIYIFMIGFCASFAINAMDIKQPIWIGNIPYAITFYSFGYISRDWKKLILLIASLILAIVSFFYPNYVGARDDVFVYGNNFPLAILCSIAFINLFYLGIKKIFHEERIFAFIGKNSLIFYISHYVFLFYCCKVLHKFGFDDIYRAIIASILLIPFFIAVIKIKKYISL